MSYGQGEKEHNRRDKGVARLRDRIGQALGIPSDAIGLSSGFMAELRGRSGVTVRGCRRILRYSREKIRLDTRDGAVTVVGEDLTCTMYCSDSIGIEGRVGGVYFDDRSATLMQSLSCSSGEGGDE